MRTLNDLLALAGDEKLRLLMAALVIFALADPIFNAREATPASGGATAIVIDNGWASAWQAVRARQLAPELWPR